MTAERLAPSLVPPPGPEQLAARDLARQYSPGDGIDEDGADFRGAWKRYADFGVFSLTIPEPKIDVDTVLGTLEGLGEGTQERRFPAQCRGA